MHWTTHLKIIACFVSLGVLVSFVLYATEPETNHKAIDFVKGSTVNNHSLTIEQLLNQSYTDVSWQYFIARNGVEVVQLNALGKYDNTESKIEWQFVVNMQMETYEIGAVRINDLVLNATSKQRYIENLLK